MEMLQIENRIGKIKLNDAVTPWSADDLISEIEKTYGSDAVEQNMVINGFTAKAEDALETLEIEINSPGGSVLDGYRVYNALQQMRSRGVKVVATVNTLAASMGSVILMAADEVKIVEGGRIMIHEASQNIAGNAADHARAAKNLEEISEEIAQIYANKTGATKEEMRELMKAETWMGAKEAVERKFADSIVTFDKQSMAMSILEKLFPNNDQVAELEAQVLENDQLRADLKLAESKLAEIANQAEALANLQNELAETQAKLDEANKAAQDHEKIVAELTEAAEATAEKVSLAASAQLAASGHPAPVAVTDGESCESLYDQYRKLQKTDPRAASEFWIANETALKSL